MNESKPWEGKADIVWNDEAGRPESAPSPERPDVERIRLSAKDDLERISGPHPTAVAARVYISLCEYTLDLEKKLKAVEEELEFSNQMFDAFHACSARAIRRWQKATGKKLMAPDGADLYCWLMDRADKADSLLARLVKAGKALDECGPYVRQTPRWDQFITALTVAKQYFDEKEK